MGLRWLLALVAAALLSSTSTADAQAFKPRGGAKTEKKAPKKTAKKGKKKAPRKTASRSKKRVTKAPPRAAEVEKTDPAEDDDDYVLIEDDDE